MLSGSFRNGNLKKKKIFYVLIKLRAETALVSKVWPHTLSLYIEGTQILYD